MSDDDGIDTVDLNVPTNVGKRYASTQKPPAFIRRPTAPCYWRT